MIRYGREDCEHIWVYRDFGWEEECMPVICKECGAFGCLCDARKDGFTFEEVNNERFVASYNINGKWINPYV